MSKVFEFSGGLNFCPGGSVFPHPKEPSLSLSLGQHVDVYFPYRKRSRISAPFLFASELLEQKKASIDVLPDECLFEILRRLPGGEERRSCAGVSKRWLMLLSSISRNEICPTKNTQSLELQETIVLTEAVKSSETNKKAVTGSDGDKVETVVEDPELDGDGYLSRCLEGRKATDIRLAAIAIGTGSRGGLGKLSIRGSNSVRGVTNLGLKAIARGCPSLRVLSLWNVSSINDEGLLEIASGCPMLEKLDLCGCPSISDKALVAVANNCPNLASLTIESCSSIGNDSLQSVGRLCPNLRSISIKNCPCVGDQGIASLVSAACSLTKLNLQALNISDVSLAVIGHYAKALTDLTLTGLQNVTEKGFWVMGNGQGLQFLKSLTINSCLGVTDLGVEAIGNGCSTLKQFCLRKCAFLSDSGLVTFAKVSKSLESLQLEECHRITQYGLFGALTNCGEKFRDLSLVNCFGVKDSNLGFPFISLCKSLRSLSIRNCPGFGNASLAILGRICPQLQHLELIGLHGITDEGFLPLVQRCESGLTKVNLSSCENLSDKAISAIARVHGSTLEFLNLDGCRHVTDDSLVAIANNCLVLSELEISKCVISDFGVAALANAVQLNLRILSMPNCSFVSDKSLPALANLGKTLVGLNIQNCYGLSDGMVDQLVEKLWRCDILS